MDATHLLGRPLAGSPPESRAGRRRNCARGPPSGGQPFGTIADATNLLGRPLAGSPPAKCATAGHRACGPPSGAQPIVKPQTRRTSRAALWRAAPLRPVHPLAGNAPAHRANAAHRVSGPPSSGQPYGTTVNATRLPGRPLAGSPRMKLANAVNRPQAGSPSVKQQTQRPSRAALWRAAPLRPPGCPQPGSPPRREAQTLHVRAALRRAALW